MIVISQQANRVAILNGWNNEKERMADLAKAKTCYMKLFRITDEDSRNWTPAEQRSWLDFITKFDHALSGRLSSCSRNPDCAGLVHTFINNNEGESLVVIAGSGLLSWIYRHCENGETSQVIDL